MKIKIAVKFKPFSHTPGASCLIPGTSVVLQAFPTLLSIGGQDWKMPLTGPVHGFTLQQDLEKDCVYVFGKAREGYFRVRVEAHDAGVKIVAEKGPLKSDFLGMEIAIAPKKEMERLSLGNHKIQDWDLVQKRGDLIEILPVLFFLGQKIPRILPQPLKGTAQLLKSPEKRAELEQALSAFFRAGFKGILVPRLMDDQHQGFVPEEKVDGEPSFLLQEGAKMVRSLFFVQNERRLQFLPHLPISFHAGRFLGTQCPGIGQIDFEWSKKLLRQVQIRANTTGEVLFEFQKEIETFRVNKKKKIKRGEPLFLEAGKTYYLDRFEK